MQIAPQLSQALNKAVTDSAAIAGLNGTAAVLDAAWKPSPAATIIAASIADPVGGRILFIAQGLAADVNDVFDAAASSLADALGVVIEDVTPVSEYPASVAVVTGITLGDATVAVAYCSAVAAPVKAQSGEAIRRLNDVEMTVTAELGRARLTVRDILGMVPGKVVELDKIAGSPIDLLVNGKLVARGEVVVIDEEFGVRVTEIVGDEF
jgi:flagellar motor switch protein FliN/FliY